MCKPMVLMLSAVLLIGAAMTAFSDVPQLMNFQGVLLDSDNNPVTTTIDVVFTIWDAPTGGADLWHEQRPVMPDSNGVFNVILGESEAITDIVFNGTDRWLGVEVEGEEQLPRTRLVSVGYAYRVSTVDGATGGTITGNVLVQSTSGGNAFSAINSGTGRAGSFFTESRGDALYGLATGTARAGYFEINNSYNASEVFRAFTNGTGEALSGESDGGIGVYAQTNSTADSIKAIHGVVSSTSALFSTAVRGENKGTFSLGYGVWGSHDGLGVGVLGTSHNGTGLYGSTEIGTGVFGTSSDGSAGVFSITEAANGSPALYVSTDGTGDAAQFKGGTVSVINDNYNTTVEIAPGEGNTGGEIVLRKSDGTQTVKLDGEEAGRGQISLFHKDGSAETVEILGTQNSDNTGGYITLRTTGETATVKMDAEEGSGGGGQITLGTGGGVETIEIDADYGDGAAFLGLSDGTQTTIWMDAKGGGGGAGVLLKNSAGENTIEIDADESDAGVMRFFDADGDATVEILAAETATNGAQIQLRKADGTATITMDAEHGEGGDGRVITEELQITGGSDLSEGFEIQGNQSNVPISPGLVVCIDPEHPGELAVSNQAYDRTVAGIISGAGGVKPGMLMGQSGSAADGEYPVALTGRVYCWVDDSNGSIQPGDLLTTSETPGHAMKVTDYDKAQGAIIGKAMSSLSEGEGLVLVLVALQ